MVAATAWHCEHISTCNGHVMQMQPSEQQQLDANQSEG